MQKSHLYPRAKFSLKGRRDDVLALLLSSSHIASAARSCSVVVVAAAVVAFVVVVVVVVFARPSHLRLVFQPRRETREKFLQEHNTTHDMSRRL